MAKTPSRGSQIDSPRKNRLMGRVAAGQTLVDAAKAEEISHNTAKKISQKYRATGSTKNRARSGRPAILDAKAKADVIKRVKANRRRVFRDIGNETEPPVSARTISRVCGECGIHRRVARKVPLLKPPTKAKRLCWAREHKPWLFRMWNNVAFSDEAYVVLGDGKGCIWVSREPGEEFADECCVPKLPQNPIRCMVWSVVMRGKKGPLIVLEYPGGKGGGMDSTRYREQVLDPVLTSFHAEMVKERPDFVFQQDGAPSHRSKATKRWFEEHNIPLFLHPPSSPDCNPIECMWNLLKTRLRALPRQPTSYDELCSTLQQLWEEISIEDLDHYINRLPRVIRAVVDAEGGHTRY